MILRALVLTLLLLVLAAIPISCQIPDATAVDTTNLLSDRQLRQRLLFAKSQAVNAGTANALLVEHLNVEIAAVHARIVRDSIRECRGNPNSRSCRGNPSQPPQPPPPIPPDTTPPPADTTPKPPQPSPPPPAFDSVLSGDYVTDIVVPDGKVWLIGKARIRGNLRTTGGTIACRPGITHLQFLGADPARYIGGGMTFAPEFANDIGLWVGPNGTLDCFGTPKVSWNRTGVDPTWLPSDEYYIAPTILGRAQGDYIVKPWRPGQPIPRVDPRVPPAEVMNVTRDCVIQGPGHVHIHSTKPQRIEYCQLRDLGITNAAGDFVLGRYALHFHMSGDGSRGSVVRGVAAVNSKGIVFVPHSSHGVTFVDNVSVNSYGPGFWWDPAHVTADVLVDHMAVCGVMNPLAIAGASGFLLGANDRGEVRNSVACGVWGGSGPAVGFDWPEPAGFADAILGKLTWKFDVGNVAHNNKICLRYWDNVQATHVTRDLKCYRNASGSDQGAYISANVYSDILSLQEGFLYSNDFSSTTAAMRWESSSVAGTTSEGSVCTRCVFESLEGPALEIGHRTLPGDPTRPLRFESSRFVPGPGKPKVWVGPGTNPWFAHFVHSGVTPDDILFESSPGNEGSVVLIDHEDGRRWRVTFANGQKVVTLR